MKYYTESELQKLTVKEINNVYESFAKDMQLSSIRYFRLKTNAITGVLNIQEQHKNRQVSVPVVFPKIKLLPLDALVQLSDKNEPLTKAGVIIDKAIRGADCIQVLDLVDVLMESKELSIATQTSAIAIVSYYAAIGIIEVV